MNPILTCVISWLCIYLFILASSIGNYTTRYYLRKTIGEKEIYFLYEDVVLMENIFYPKNSAIFLGLFETIDEAKKYCLNRDFLGNYKFTPGSYRVENKKFITDDINCIIEKKLDYHKTKRNVCYYALVFIYSVFIVQYNIFLK